MGAGSVGATGQFNFSVEEGYLIHNGKLGQPVKGATLIGDAKEVMPKISMCADDLDSQPVTAVLSVALRLSVNLTSS